MKKIILDTDTGSDDAVAIVMALRDPGVLYQVELEGLQNASGLERMAVFTAQIGKARYTGCRWKRLELTAGKAVFLAANREEMEETP